MRGFIQYSAVVLATVAVLTSIITVICVAADRYAKGDTEFWSNDDWSAAVGREREAQEHES